MASNLKKCQSKYKGLDKYTYNYNFKQNLKNAKRDIKTVMRAYRQKEQDVDGGTRSQTSLCEGDGIRIGLYKVRDLTRECSKEDPSRRPRIGDRKMWNKFVEQYFMKISLCHQHNFSSEYLWKS